MFTDNETTSNCSQLLSISRAGERRLCSGGGGGGGGGEILSEKLGGVCSMLPETLTLHVFQTKICDFPCPISDLIKNLIPYFRPKALEPGT